MTGYRRFNKIKFIALFSKKFGDLVFYCKVSY